MTTIPKLTSLSTQTLELVLQFSSSPGNERIKAQVKTNLGLLRAGIREIGKSNAGDRINGLRSQYERMRGIVGEDEVESLNDEEEEEAEMTPIRSKSPESFKPYTDDPNVDLEANFDPHQVLQTQREIMDTQDNHLDVLSSSIGRQHHLSLQINDELGVHMGLLESLDDDVDRTQLRLGRAGRALGRVEEGVKGNISTVTIGVLILLLLILIIVFKT